MRLKSKVENERHEINYLNLSIRRLEDGTLIMSWWHKECSSLQIMNYHSYVPKRLKETVTREYVLSALRIASSECIVDVRKQMF